MTRDNIFPSPFWYIEGAPQQLVDELYEGAYRFKEKYPSANRSNQGGYQTPNFHWEEFHPQGIEVINKLVYEAIEHEFKVESWWYNISGKENWNAPHTHPDCDYALILYLTNSDGLLALMNPFPSRYKSNNIKVDAKKGDIIIFPSDIMHFVKPNQKDTDRISISMNLQLCRY